MREEGAPAAERYITFLKTGDAAFPIDAIRAAGVDMTDPAPVQAAFDVLAGYVERLEQLTARCPLPSPPRVGEGATFLSSRLGRGRGWVSVLQFTGRWGTENGCRHARMATRRNRCNIPMR